MPPDPQRDLWITGAAFTRCGACGRRVRLAAPTCPAHGTVAGGPQGLRSPGSGDRDVDPAEITAVDLQHFPGYQTLRLLGHGGFGTVFAAEPEAGGPPVAIKLARTDREGAGLRLVHELAVLGDVGPPHVPAVYGSGDLAGAEPYLIMELVDAPTLADRLADPEPVRLDEAVAIALAILRALEAVHARGWVHCDLKPENVFVDASGGARIVDFGLGAAASAGHAETAEGPVGTAEYMAPEQCDRQGDIDARADVYAMGVILYELVAGAPPFWGPPAAVHQSHLARRPPRLSSAAPGAAIPPWFEHIVHRCLAKDRDDRYESAAALREALVLATASPTPAVAPRASGAPVEAEARRAPATDERRTVSLVFFESDADVLTLEDKLATLGGQVAHASGERYVVVYDHDAGDNPARPALRAAHALLREGVCQRARLDVGAVSVQSRRDGSRRFLSPLFTREERFPSPADPPGLSVTPAAAAVLSGPAGPPSARAAVAEARPPLPSLTSTDPDLTAADTGPLIGRDPVLDALIESARRAASEPIPTMVVVSAEAGHGKTHLFSTLVRRLRRLPIAGEVVDLRARESSLGGADQTVKDLLQRTLDLPEPAPPEGAGELLRDRLGRLGRADAAPAVSIALGWTAPGAPGPAMEAALRTLGAAPGALRSALTTAAGEALRRRAAGRPVWLLLDDAHHADEATLAALEYAALAEAGAPLWICALGRPAFEEEHPSWGERAGRREVHRLAALDPASAADLCRRLLLPVEDIPDSAVDLLVERAQAIPLLLVELTRGLLREGLVRRRPTGGSYHLATDELDRLPDLPLVEWLAHGELDALPEALKAHALLLSLLGDEVSIPDVAGVLARLEEQGGDAELPLDAKVGTRRLVAAGLLVEKKGRIAFRHALVREAIAGKVPAPLRRRVHLAAVVHYLESGDGAAADRRLAQLAFHAAQAGLGAVAETAYLNLAERMRARHAYLPAERYFSRALEQRGAEVDARRLGALRGRALMRYRVAGYHDSLADFAAARELARLLGDVAAGVELLLDEATVLDWMDEYKSSEERVEQARALLADVRSPLLGARLHLGVGRSLHRFSREEEAAAALERAAAEAAALGDEGYETLVIALMILGFIYPGLGRLDDALQALYRVIQLCEEHGDLLHLAGAINNRALLWAFLGDRAAMIADMERGLALARQLGQAPVELVSRYNLGEYLYLMDDPDAAEPHVRRAIEIEQRLRGDAGRPVVALLEARLRFFRGDEGAARAILARVDARQEEARALGQTDGLMVPSEQVLHDAIDLATRGAGDAEWEALEARAAEYSIGQERIEVLEARAIAALRRGRAEEALRGIEKALDAAARIPNVMGARLDRALAEARRLHALGTDTL